MTDYYPIKSAILNKIREYDKIILMRHSRPDGDASGSTLGLASILRASFPGKDIRVINEDHGEYIAFLGKEEPQEPDDFYRDALGIVCDTGTKDRISNKKYALVRELIKIDHHIDTAPYGDLSWVEPDRSSVCEMITEFYRCFASELQLPAEAASCLYAGMITDSGRFYYDSTSGETLRLAGLLLDRGIDTDLLLSNLYMESPDYYRYKAYVYDHIRYSEHGVAYLYVTREMQERFCLTTEQASSTIDFLGKIRGALIWLAFIEYPDSIRVRLRSRYVTVSELANRFGGGGHARASGATVYSEEAMNRLIDEADVIVGDYKKSHTGWI